MCKGTVMGAEDCRWAWVWLEQKGRDGGRDREGVRERGIDKNRNVAEARPHAVC